MEIDILMSPDTLAALQQNGFSLYGFRAVRTTSRGGAPTVGFQTDRFLPTTQLFWADQYQAYISDSQIIPNGVIKALSAVDITLGQKANVASNGSLTVAGTGPPTAISILNTDDAQWTAGISGTINDIWGPMCALPLSGQMLDVIIPIEKVLLMFAAATMSTGTVIDQSFSSGILVDLTDAPRRMVIFDINNGWKWDGGIWGTLVPPNENLAPILIGN